MKHDIIVRVLKALRIEKRPGSTANIVVEPKMQYDTDPSLIEPYTGLEIPHWQYIADYIENSLTDGFIIITGGGALPPGPSAGDVHIMDNGTIMQYDGDDWQDNGTVPMASSGSSITIDPSLPNPPTLSYLTSTYPAASPDDKVIREGSTQIIEATCYKTGEWSWVLKNRAL